MVILREIPTPPLGRNAETPLCTAATVRKNPNPVNPIILKILLLTTHKSLRHD